MTESLISVVINSLRDLIGLLETTGDLDLATTRIESLLLLFWEVENQEPWVATIVSILRPVISILDNQHSIPNSVGRPRIDFQIEAIEYLLALNFHVPKIAQLLGVSRRTLFRRMSENNLSVNQSYAQISEDQLNTKIATILCNHPNTGYKRMKGFLMAQGVKVTTDRVIVAMRYVDPNGVYQRAMQNRAIVRRQYYVPYSNSLWHLDTNMKLIRWKIVIRSAIDGKSRLATYLHASADNLAVTNLAAFMEAVSIYGTPLRTRSDKGRENVLIARYMLETRGLNRGSHICGRSVNNQRIERFWRDVFRCSGFYYGVFNQMEHEGILNIDDMKHLALLHFVFLPRLNRHLKEFQDGWNHHPISTEHNFSPMQLMLTNLPPPSLDLPLLDDDMHNAHFICNAYQDLDAMTDELDAHDETIVNPTVVTNYLNQEDLHRLQALDVLKDSDSYGRDIFQEALNLINLM